MQTVGLSFTSLLRTTQQPRSPVTMPWPVCFSPFRMLFGALLCAAAFLPSLAYSSGIAEWKYWKPPFISALLNVTRNTTFAWDPDTATLPDNIVNVVSVCTMDEAVTGKEVVTLIKSILLTSLTAPLNFTLLVCSTRPLPSSKVQRWNASDDHRRSMAKVQSQRVPGASPVGVDHRLFMAKEQRQ